MGPWFRWHPELNFVSPKIDQSNRALDIGAILYQLGELDYLSSHNSSWRISPTPLSSCIRILEPLGVFFSHLGKSNGLPLLQTLKIRYSRSYIFTRTFPTLWISPSLDLTRYWPMASSSSSTLVLSLFDPTNSISRLLKQSSLLSYKYDSVDDRRFRMTGTFQLTQWIETIIMDNQ